MKRFLILPAIFAAFAISACGGTSTAADACADAKSTVKAQSFEREGTLDDPEGGEARCNNNVEIESEDATSINNGYWTADE